MTYTGAHRQEAVRTHRAPSRRWPRLATITGAALAFVLVAAIPASAATAIARSGEGVIAITQRTCGSSAGWQNVAKANGITASSGYRVLLGQRLNVTCSGKAPTATTSTGWRLPLASYRLTSCYGMRWGKMHRGLDMAAPYGTPIRAMAAGTVKRAGWVWGGYGISVVVTSGAWTFHLAHMSREIVSPGQRVAKGQIVGYVGSTGQSTGNHTHVEIATRSSVLGYQVNPAPWLRARGVRVGC